MHAGRHHTMHIEEEIVVAVPPRTDNDSLTAITQIGESLEGLFIRRIVNTCSLKGSYEQDVLLRTLNVAVGFSSAIRFESALGGDWRATSDHDDMQDGKIKAQCTFMHIMHFMSVCLIVRNENEKRTLNVFHVPGM